ncbi:MAG TPA: CPBP family intramembrane metalloprotease, partial [Ottowia sp.]|nr:CPBP family intramembrane metalloprotease [Ottowia sp.]
FGMWGFGPSLLHLLLGQRIRSLVDGDGQWLASIYLDLLRLLVVLAAAFVAARWIDRRPLADWGFHFNRRWWADLLFGMALGAALMAAIFAVQWLLGWVTITGFWSAPPGVPFAAAILAPLVLAVVVSVAEELLSRGNQLLNLAEGFRFLGLRPAVLLAWLISSIIFGALHVSNPNSSWLSTGYLVFYGAFLGAGYVLTGELALPIGLHFTWNFVQGSILGFPVSGRPLYMVSVIDTQQAGPDLWTGGAFGPEAGLLGLLAGLIGLALTVWWVRWQEGVISFERLAANMGPKE